MNFLLRLFIEFLISTSMAATSALATGAASTLPVGTHGTLICVFMEG